MKKRILLVAFIATFLAVSCSKEINNNQTPESPSNGSKGNVLIQTVVTNDGQAGSSYIQLLEGVTSQKIDNKNAFPVGVGVPPVVYKNWVFTFPSYFGSDVSELNKFVRENGVLKKESSLALPAKSQATHLVVLNENKAYVGLTGLGKILIFNPTTMVKISEIDLNKYGDPNPEPTGMIIRDNHLFITLGQWKGATWFPSEKVVEAIVVDVQTDTILKHIKETTSGLSFPMDPGQLMVMDEAKNIYIFCVGAFGQVQGFDGGIVRIKAGETEFDTTYFINFSQINVPGEPGKVVYLRSCRYEGNGIVYGYAYIKEYDPNGNVSPLSIASVAVKVDLNKKTITRIAGIPVTNGYSCAIGKYKNLFVFGNTSQTAKGYYTYDPATDKASPEPVINVEGYPQFFHWFE